MKNNLFRKYCAIFSLCFVLSITILGAVLMLFAARYFQNERYVMLGRNARQAAAITALNYGSNMFGRLDRTVIRTYYSIFAGSINAEIFLADTEGALLFSLGVQSEKSVGKTISPDIVRQVMSGHYEETGTLGGLFSEPYYTVGVPVMINDRAIGVLFASSSAETLGLFLFELVRMFLVSSAVVVFISFVLIYLVTSSLVKPLKEMLAATQSFSQGDFSKRVQVSGYDELGQLAMAFNNMASTLANTETTRRSFVANVSHELKTPMTTIGGFVDGILDGTIPDEKRDQYLRVVSDEVKRLARLVRSMLDTSRIETGELQINPVLFDISETVRQSVFNFEQAIDEKKLEISGLETDKIMVLADEDLMHQVVYNLVENAVKFVNPGGVISVSYHVDSFRTYVAVRNTGKGIPKSEVPLLFERFYKSDRSRSENLSGVGLGLHIVKSIINYHRGDIVVRSAEDEYTEFEFCLPNPEKKAKPQKTAEARQLPAE